MKQLFRRSLVLPFFIVLTALSAIAGDSDHGKSNKKKATNTDGDVTITIPAGFKASLFADKIGKPRHITVSSNGYVYVKLANKKDGNTIVRLKDTNGDGKADEVIGFGNFTGTGIAIKNGYLYASSDEEVYRYKLDAKNQVISPNQPEKVVIGLLSRHEHEAKAITLDNEGNLYVNIGAYSNSCQLKDRERGSMGMKPCPILDSAGGIWLFKADKLNQTYGDGVRYATGLRNVVGLDWNTATNSLFVMQHGRDQLNTIFPDMFDAKQNAELPAECMYELHKGSNCGWPYMYYDPAQKKKMLMPEYGGDGKIEGGQDAQDPVVAFPAHIAPNGLLFYSGNQFPEKYRNGAFVAFHGSWNRAPEPQKGFLVAFVPFKDGKPTGDWEIFADGFAGGPDLVASGRAKHRPCGLAQGPDGSIYVTDDQGGSVWKISYTGK